MLASSTSHGYFNRRQGTGDHDIVSSRIQVLLLVAHVVLRLAVQIAARSSIEDDRLDAARPQTARDVHALAGFEDDDYDDNLTTASNAAVDLSGGVEWAFMDHWSAKFEYLYIDFGNGPIVPISSSLNLATGHMIDNIARVGVNYRFY